MQHKRKRLINRMWLERYHAYSLRQARVGNFLVQGTDAEIKRYKRVGNSNHRRGHVIKVAEGRSTYGIKHSKSPVLPKRVRTDSKGSERPQISICDF